ncbi:peptidoglycan-associated lipoprotein Pal [Noviherbaspirillum pedocola]|uniref:Peptidoglycan-associated lipoprotein n=1 Tax=Noviherbaspirillum pedocola TaxID=2801341 RepID=A0A934SXK6_9BURK|nr:peptidoglycan-associated lipoprotein Pal [Noviherbaspirillum pedocola]MBK4733613.1 peptidoglycan-associated lipoprotein Pal [Noviherbaspirillum pedocola]
MRISHKFVLALSSALLVTACSSPVKLDDKAAVVDRSAAGTQSADPRSVNTINATGSNMDPLNDPQGVLAKRSVYFDLDSYTVKDEYKPVLEAHAKYLNAHKDRHIVIQGNTDERGGREYNLALGQKRAEAVRRAMSLLGVQQSQMEAISFGKEKPKALGSDEAAYAENRRADIAY